MKYSISALCFALLVGCSMFTRPPEAPSAPDNAVFAAAMAKARDGTIGLLAQRPDGSWRAFCSGAWVDHSHVVTAAHCVDDDLDPDEPHAVESVTVGLAQDYAPEKNIWLVRQRMDVIWADFETDLALLRWAEPRLPPAHTVYPLLERETLVGEEVLAIGHPFGQGYFFSQGRVIHPRRTHMGHMAKLWTQHSAPTYPGMSGGPVVLMDGSLVCITSFGWDDHLTGCAHRDMIAEIMAGL